MLGKWSCMRRLRRRFHSIVRRLRDADKREGQICSSSGGVRGNLLRIWLDQRRCVRESAVILQHHSKSLSSVPFRQRTSVEQDHNLFSSAWLFIRLPVPCGRLPAHSSFIVPYPGCTARAEGRPCTVQESHRKPSRGPCRRASPSCPIRDIRIEIGASYPKPSVQRPPPSPAHDKEGRPSRGHSTDFRVLRNQPFRPSFPHPTRSALLVPASLL